jgi:hypothetical protein
LTAPRDQRLDRRLHPFGDRLHRAVGAIHHPTRKSESLRLLDR